MKTATYAQHRQARKRQKEKKLGRLFLLVCFCTILFTTVKVAGIAVDNFNEQAGKTVSSYAHSIFAQLLGDTKIPDRSQWNLLLVNPENPLPDNFEVELVTLNNGLSVDERILPDLQRMMDDARSEGFSPVICSAYRTEEKQTSLFDNKVEKYLNQGYSQGDAKVMAAEWVAIPGTSEHQAGLALDIVSKSYQQLDSEQADTAVQQWLMKNAWRYGFILRYPEDKTEITGIRYEPWHYRYVGKDAATKITQESLCLEEYLEQ